MYTQSRQSLIAIVGPTGVGKTAFAITVAKKIKAELISVDSRQIYIGMDIATGKEAELGSWINVNGRKVLDIDGSLIHGLDLVRPDEQFSVYDWYELAIQLIGEIEQRGNVPLLVGGTGFYLNALQGKIETLSFQPNTELREKLESMTVQQLKDRLKNADPQRLSLIDESNKRRLIRAVEIAEAASNFRDQKSPMPFYDVQLLGLTMVRQKLYRKVDARVEAMFAGGLVDETRELLKSYNPTLPSMSGIGYAEVADYLAGKFSYEEAVQKMKWRVHSYIRRQYTWFNKQSVEWIDVDRPGWQDGANDYIRQKL